MTPEQFEQAKREISEKYFPTEEKLSNNSLYNQLQQSSQDNLLSDLTALLEQHKEMMEFDHLTNEAIKIDDIFDKMNCLIGYLERWRDNPQSNNPPFELNSVIEEAIDWLKNVKKSLTPICAYRESTGGCIPGCGTDSCMYHPNNR